MNDALHDSGLEPVLVPADTILSPGPTVEVEAHDRQTGTLILGGKHYTVTAPKEMYAAELMDALGDIVHDLPSSDSTRRRKALQALREFLACIFSRDGHPADDYDLQEICTSCDACEVLRHLRSPSTKEDIRGMSKSFGKLMEGWGKAAAASIPAADRAPETTAANGNRASRRAAAKRGG